MKIGILTVHKSEVNYGASLQAFALWKYVSDLGHETEIIDLLRPCHQGYKRSRKYDKQEQSFLQRIKTIIWGGWKKHHQAKKMNDRDSIFGQFNSIPRYSRTINSVDEVFRAGLDYDVYIAGSDQIWNPNMPFANAPYFLTFAPVGRKRISYASSFGVSTLPEQIKKEYGEWLASFDHLSVREESGALIIRELIGKEAQVVLDPVFLLNAEIWRAYTKKVSGIKEDKYVLLYMLSYDEDLIEQVSSYARQHDLPLYFVLSENKEVTRPYAKQLLGIGPQEWLWLIDHATCVFTTSFHGTAFCVILNKPFAVFLKENAPTNTRVTGLLERLGMSGNIYQIGKSFPKQEQITKRENAETLLTIIEESKNYLTKAIES